ncbi:MAG: lysophospholipid acyltransferase family protein [Gemmatimonadetes bacterium]|nr:lysophospholipid acyltransferase family protein [Gemmatimonadota bacterium]
MISSLIRTLAATWRFQVVGREHLVGFWPGSQPAIWALWHGHFLPLLWLHRYGGTTLLISRHPDANPLAHIAGQWGYRTLRGSSTRGGVCALLGLIRSLRRGGQVAIAADGPRGPREHAKPGAVAAALSTGAPIIPVAVAAHPAWRLGSWDGFLVPAPGASVRVAYGVPFSVPATGRRDLRPATSRLQERLEQVAHRAAG